MTDCVDCTGLSDSYGVFLDCKRAATVELVWACVHEHIDTFAYCDSCAQLMRSITRGLHPDWWRVCCVRCCDVEESHPCEAKIVKEKVLV